MSRRIREAAVGFIHYPGDPAEDGDLLIFNSLEPNGIRPSFLPRVENYQARILRIN